MQRKNHIRFSPNSDRESRHELPRRPFLIYRILSKSRIFRSMGVCFLGPILVGRYVRSKLAADGWLTQSTLAALRSQRALIAWQTVSTG